MDKRTAIAEGMLKLNQRPRPDFNGIGWAGHVRQGGPRTLWACIKAIFSGRKAS